MWTESDDEMRPPSPGPAGLRVCRPQEPPPALGPVAAAAVPPIAQLNVSKNSRMHIGPKFVSVTQNVHNSEVVKGRVLGLELHAEAGAGAAAGAGAGVGARRLRCSVAVFVCWALVVAGGLTVYVCQLAFADRPSWLDLGLTEPWYLRRIEWQAMPPYGITFLRIPARFVLVGHSASPWCDERYNCTEKVLAIQRLHMRFGWPDIGPNFLVSGNGLVFEGRGSNAVGAMVRGWNNASITVMFLGDYRRGHDEPAPVQLQNVARLLEQLVRVGALHPQYTLLAHCQAVPKRIPPGLNLVHALHAFDHWNGTDTSGCLG